MNYKDAAENLKYYQGEHFEFWIGPTVPQSASGYSEKMAHLKRVFQSANLIQECCNNWKNGLIAEPFTWHLKDSSGKRVQASEAEIQLQRWIDWVNQQAIAIDPGSTNFKQSDPWSECVLSLGVTGEGNLRLWQPAKYANDSDPIHQIHLHAPKTGSVAVERDDDGFVKSLAYTYGQNNKEVQEINDTGSVVVTDGDKEPLTIETGGRWLIQNLQCPSLLTPSIKQLQNSINHALTMKLRNQELSGFREKVFINAEFPDAEVERGPGIDTYLYGILQGDPTASSYATPSIHESQPVPIATFVESMQIDRSMIYMEFHQGYLLAANDGGLSGESRIQLRQGFELYLRGWQRRVEAAFANVLNIVLRILGYTDLEAIVMLNISTGKLSADERQAIIAEFQGGLLSKATALAALGTVDDVDAEMALIEEEIQTALQRQQALADPLGLGANGDGNGDES